MTHKDVCFIAAKEKYDFSYDAIENYGFCQEIPYKDLNIFLRLIREVWFRLHLPYREIWFNKRIKLIRSRIIIIKDPLVCKELLKYIRKRHEDKTIILMYVNRVKTSFPANEAKGLVDELWSYDTEDCNEYGMRLMGDYYYEMYCSEEKHNNKPIYDVVYLGRDKGRASYLLELKNSFEEMGLKTLFRITPDRSYMRFKKRLYQPVIPYREYVKMLEKSRALLNVMPEGQNSITPRDLEVIFHSVKGITNNKGVKKRPYYHPDRYFVLGEDEIEDLPAFLERPFPTVDATELSSMHFDNMVFNMFQ